MSRPDMFDEAEKTEQPNWEQEYKDLKQVHLYLDDKYREQTEQQLVKYREQHITQLERKEAELHELRAVINKLEREIDKLEDIQYGLREGLKAVLNI